MDTPNTQELPGDIYRLIPQVMGEVGAIEKSRRNQQQGYQYRGIDDVYAAVHGPLVKAGVFIVPRVREVERTERATKSGGVLFYTVIKCEFDFCAGDGSRVTVATIGEAMDSGDKSSNKAMSAALKYALFQVLCIPTWEPENDADASSPEPAPKQQAAPATEAPKPEPLATKQQVDEFNRLVKQASIDADTLTKMLNKEPAVTRFGQMTQRRLDSCIKYVRGVVEKQASEHADNQAA